MGTLVIGKMESGCVAKGDNLIAMPNKVGKISSNKVLSLSYKF